MGRRACKVGRAPPCRPALHHSKRGGGAARRRSLPTRQPTCASQQQARAGLGRGVGFIGGAHEDCRRGRSREGERGSKSGLHGATSTRPRAPTTPPAPTCPQAGATPIRRCLLIGPLAAQVSVQAAGLGRSVPGSHPLAPAGAGVKCAHWQHVAWTWILTRPGDGCAGIAGPAGYPPVATPTSCRQRDRSRCFSVCCVRSTAVRGASCPHGTADKQLKRLPELQHAPSPFSVRVAGSCNAPMSAADRVRLAPPRPAGRAADWRPHRGCNCPARAGSMATVPCVGHRGAGMAPAGCNTFAWHSIRPQASSWRKDGPAAAPQQPQVRRRHSEPRAEQPGSIQQLLPP
jgi:hypothetical protein